MTIVMCGVMGGVMNVVMRDQRCGFSLNRSCLLCQRV